MQEQISRNASIEELADRIADKIEERIIARTNYSKKDRYLTRRQLSELLSVDLSTLHRWSKAGRLPSYRMGGKIYYKYSDLEREMKKVPNLKDGKA
ncbi:MAG: helix-turn-helix domain-containing protein [Methanosarcinaceae archaeon]|nr:helix-turn-helix domain-containing protein [Methanosarcinaceae archaeon]